MIGVKAFLLKRKMIKLSIISDQQFFVNGVATINCYPGMDYVYHYASLVKTYLAILGIKKKITAQFPTVQEIENQLMHSNINEIPKCKTVILCSRF